MREIGSSHRSKLAVMVVAATVAVVSISLPPWIPAAAAAAPLSGADDATAVRARRHYEEGTKAFNLGEFARAIAEFKAAYNAKPDPLLLYNIGQSYRLGGDAGQALFFYKSFLRNMPTAPNRKDVEALIRRLERQVEDQKREPAVTTLPPASAGAGLSAPPPAFQPPPVVVSPPAQTPALSPGTAASSTAPTPTWAAAPAPRSPAPSDAPQVDLTAPAHQEPESDRPIYKKWWFWAGAAGAVVVIGVLVAASANRPPDTTLGTFATTFE